MWEQIVDLAHNEIVAYVGMMLIIRAYLIDEWAFFILEVAWFAAAALGLWSITKSLR